MCRNRDGYLGWLDPLQYLGRGTDAPITRDGPAFSGASPKLCQHNATETTQSATARQASEVAQHIHVDKVVPGDGFEPPTRGFSIRHQIQEKQEASVSKTALTNRELNENVSNADLTGTNENPDALAGAIGADMQSWFDWIDGNTRRESAARALCLAVADCDPADAVRFLEIIHDHLSAGHPIPNPYRLMPEAREWASWASTAECKAYALACYEALSPADQAAFLHHVRAQVAA